MEIICGVYKIQSLVHPDRCYIGSSINVNYRFNRHKSALRHKKHHSLLLQRHCDKYGIEDLVFSILQVCKREDLVPVNGVIRPEQFFIWANAHEKHGYEKPYFNTNAFAGSRLGDKDSEETREKKRQAMMGRKHTLGMKQSPEAIENIRIAQIKINQSESVRQNKREKMKGKQNNLGHKDTAETRRRKSEALLGRPKSKEHAENISKARFKYYADKRLLKESTI